MSAAKLPVLDLRHWRAGGDQKRAFVKDLGDALSEIGFFALTGHDVKGAVLDDAFDAARTFFSSSDEVKRAVYDPAAKAQRGYTPLLTERALGQSAPDQKEFFQVGRPDVPDDHPVHVPYGANRWPTTPNFVDSVKRLYLALDDIALDLLRACALFIDEEAEFFTPLATGGDTILRLIHYPPSEGGVRAGAHEDINLITLLPGAISGRSARGNAPEGGLELKERDGTWRPVAAGRDTLVVDTGDMMQHLTNGLLRAVTHRVVVPDGGAKTARYSMPFFVHPRHDADLTPREKCVARTGGVARFSACTARELLDERLKAIGVA